MIRFENVSKAYGRRRDPAVHDVTLDIDSGEFAFVVGASGSGKSTLLRLILREEAPTSGKLTVGGRDLAKLKRRHVPLHRRSIGMVFQDFRLLPEKTVYQNVAYVLHVLGAPSALVKKAVPETLEMVGLSGKEKRLPHELSGGEQQRVAIARAVVKSPPVLLCDEPTGNLDPSTSLEIVSLLDQINLSGTTVLMATHDEEIVNQLRRRVIELADGRVVRDQARGVYTGPR